MNYFELLYKKYNKTVLTADEVAEEIGISLRNFMKQHRDGLLPIAVMQRGRGGKLFFPLRSFCAYLEAVEELAG